MSTMRWCWRKDLAEFRGLSERDRSGFLLVLEWFENFRLRHDLDSGRDSAKTFWKTEVLREDRPRQDWQLEQWGDAIHWYLNWLQLARKPGRTTAVWLSACEPLYAQPVPAAVWPAARCSVTAHGLLVTPSLPRTKPR